MISFDDFKKLDIRVAAVKEASDHPDADRLLVLKVDIGGEEKQIVAGIKGAYTPEELVGKKIVLLANMEPAQIRGVESQGMLLAARDGEALAILTLDKDITTGSKIS